MKGFIYLLRSDERIDKGVLLWIILVERIENDRTDKRMYGGKCAGSPSVGRPPKDGLVS